MQVHCTHQCCAFRFQHFTNVNKIQLHKHEHSLNWYISKWNNHLLSAALQKIWSIRVHTQTHLQLKFSRKCLSWWITFGLGRRFVHSFVRAIVHHIKSTHWIQDYLPMLFCPARVHCTLDFAFCLFYAHSFRLIYHFVLCLVWLSLI